MAREVVVELLRILGLPLLGLLSSLSVDSWDADFFGESPWEDILGEQVGDIVPLEEVDPLLLSVNQEKGTNCGTAALAEARILIGLSKDSLLPVDILLAAFSAFLPFVDEDLRSCTPRSKNFLRAFLSSPTVGLAGSAGLVSLLPSEPSLYFSALLSLRV